MTESEDYDITWTMPHCVLTLKLIALAFDLWDGKKMLRGLPLSENNRLTALIDTPTLEELIGFIYFPACFLVGPIFSFRRYLDFITDKFPVNLDREIIASRAMKRLLQGLGYLIAFQVGTSCIRFGLSFNGYVKKSPEDNLVSTWDGCSNIKLMRFEGATKFQHYIDSFNCNTNYFAAEYVYKRLKFLGNRNLSQFFTLLFLALWHGTRSGYYMTFFNEFIIIYMDKEFESIISKTNLYKKLWASKAKYLLYAFLKTYTIVFMGWSLIPFDLKVFSKWWQLYATLYFSGFIVFLPWAYVYKPALNKLVKWYTPSQ
ncbi:lysophospholipid acyltransferase 5-like [Pararge aegeria]|uniref:lysophospholipid acyltransferase 5-like n=1 Tax=Pararge aegeria TaxID=116150 RepID=UPI0019D2CDB4|nr:lysophospholipid acyltransferase 5-like [Pararge aegeria]